MTTKRRTFSPEFKREAVKQVVERNYKISDVAARSGVTTKTKSRIYHCQGARY